MLHGLGDRIVPQQPVKAAIEIMPPRPDSKLAFYKNGYHLLLRDKAGPAVTGGRRGLDRQSSEASCPRAPMRSNSQPEMASLLGLEA